jgi:hypothetical protein
MAPQTRFVILAGPRTGSTYLVDYLDALPETRCHSELFQDGRIDFRHHEPAEPRLGDIAFRDAQPMEFLDRVAETAKECRRFGFKVIGSQLATCSADFIREICVGTDWKKIYLWRDDLFEQSVSYLLAARHFGGGIWERTPDQSRITLAPKDLMACLHMVQTTYFVIEAVLVNARAEDVFSLNYRDLGSPSVMGDLLRFLGVPESAHRKLDFHPGPALSQRIENQAEIRRFFLNSRYRRLIEQSLAA